MVWVSWTGWLIPSTQGKAKSNRRGDFWFKARQSDFLAYKYRSGSLVGGHWPGMLQLGHDVAPRFACAFDSQWLPSPLCQSHKTQKHFFPWLSSPGDLYILLIGNLSILLINPEPSVSSHIHSLAPGNLKWVSVVFKNPWFMECHTWNKHNWLLLEWYEYLLVGPIFWNSILISSAMLNKRQYFE